MQATTPVAEQLEILCGLLSTQQTLTSQVCAQVTEVATALSRQMETLTTEVEKANKSAAAALKECIVVRQDKEAAQSKINTAQVVVAEGPEAGSVTVSRVLFTHTLKPGVIVRLLAKQLVEIVEVKVEGRKCTVKGFLLQDAKTLEADKGVTRLVNLATGVSIEADAVGEYLLTDLDVDVSVSTIAATDPFIDMPTYRLVGEGVMTGLVPMNWRKADGHLIESSPGKWSLEKAELVRACPLEQKALWFWNCTGPLYAVYREFLQERLDKKLESFGRGPDEIVRAEGRRELHTCRMCKRTCQSSEVFELDGLKFCGDQCQPKYVVLGYVHAAALKLGKKGLPLDARLAADFSDKVARLQELTFPSILPETTDLTQEENKAMEERKEEN